MITLIIKPEGTMKTGCKSQVRSQNTRFKIMRLKIDILICFHIDALNI